MNLRHFITALLAFLGGAYFFLQFILPDQITLPNSSTIDLIAHHSQISIGFSLVSIMAIGLGIINLIVVHGSRLLARRKNWDYSLVLLIGLVLSITVYSSTIISANKVAKESRAISILRDFAEKIISDYNNPEIKAASLSNRVTALLKSANETKAHLNKINYDIANEVNQLQPFFVDSLKNLEATCLNQNEDKLCLDSLEKFAPIASSYSIYVSETLSKSNDQSFSNRLYQILFSGLFIPLGSSMFSLLGFYVVTAAFRAFRVRSTESLLMTLSALLVMLGQISFGLLLWPYFAEIRMWLLQTPNTAAFRAITIGAEVAALVLAFRMWLSLETDTFNKK
jgi:hypothetical protein